MLKASARALGGRTEAGRIDVFMFSPPGQLHVLVQPLLSLRYPWYYYYSSARPSITSPIIVGSPLFYSSSNPSLPPPLVGHFSTQRLFVTAHRCLTRWNQLHASTTALLVPTFCSLPTHFVTVACSAPLVGPAAHVLLFLAQSRSLIVCPRRYRIAIAMMIMSACSMVVWPVHPVRPLPISPSIASADG